MTPETPDRPLPSAEPATLPVVALVCAILGLCLPPLLAVAIVLAIISLVKSGEPGYASRKGLAIAALVIPVALLPVIGILAAIAIPNFIRFQSRAKQSECKSNLKAAFVAEKSLFAERDAYSVHLAELGFLPERGNRYLYLFNARGPVLEPGGPVDATHVGVGPDTARHPDANAITYRGQLPADLDAELGVHGDCPDCDVTIACVGNIDNDDTLDVWSVSTRERVDKEGLSVPPGVPMAHVDDTRE